MSDAARLLELIETCLVEHGGDLGGWTLLEDDALQVFDGRATLRAELRDASPAAREGMVHAHVFATLHEYDDEVLDACLFGMGDDREGALKQAAAIWMTAVAGPIRSFLDDRPICMTCRAGVPGGDPSAGEVEGDYGLPGLRAFVGPMISRAFDDEPFRAELDETRPWFRFAAESAAPRRVHLAKASVIARGKEGWLRVLEIDGHDVSHKDPDWPAGGGAPEFGYATRFAVFEFPPDSPEIARRAELERTIRRFAEDFAKHETADSLMEDMIARGFDPDLVHECESIATMAFGRLFFEPAGIRYSSTVIRARRDGRVEADVPLMSIPAYSRARALAAELRETMPDEEFRSLCLYHAESNGIVKAIEAAGAKLNLARLKFCPCIVPDRGASDETVAAAHKVLQEWIDRGREAGKPWWKFW
ncbi:hypothetical protein [Paludisphaera soli]|uniref:hypothetical protein n=1 Tax=Paludisphaera soli TaxID=2712865 RepID=UPI0013EC6C35|nr:hypothetical protein [Paludisphaera soli]